MAASTVMLAIIAIIVGAIAGYLIVIAYSLWRISFTVGTILIGIRSIQQQTEPIGGVVAGIADDVSAIESALGGLVRGAELPGGDSRALTGGFAPGRQPVS